MINYYVTGMTGANCSTVIDTCNPNPCLNAGNCTGNSTFFNCTCAVGFTGTNCQFQVNECQSNPCQNGGTCQLQSGYQSSYICLCPTGYSGTNCQVCWFILALESIQLILTL